MVNIHRFPHFGRFSNAWTYHRWTCIRLSRCGGSLRHSTLGNMLLEERIKSLAEGKKYRHFAKKLKEALIVP